MRKITLVVVVIFLFVGAVLAGEYQKESAAFEKAFAAGDYAKAVTLAKTGVGKGNALNMQGYTLYLAGNFKAAKAIYLQAIAADSKQYWAHNSLGAILLSEGDCAGAIREFELSGAASMNAPDDGAEARVTKAQQNIETAKRYCE